MLCTYSGDVNAKSRRVVIYRGSALMWTKDIVDFGYKKGKVTYSSGFQMNGWIFPNIATNKGIKRFYKGKTVHKYRAINTIGAGVKSPWGDVKIYSQTFSHRIYVYGSGDVDRYKS